MYDYHVYKKQVLNLFLFCECTIGILLYFYFFVYNKPDNFEMGLNNNKQCRACILTSGGIKLLLPRFQCTDWLPLIRTAISRVTIGMLIGLLQDAVSRSHIFTLCEFADRQGRSSLPIVNVVL